MSASDIYEPRRMIRNLEINPAEQQFLRKTFFREEVYHETDYVEFDIEVSKRRIASYVHPSADAKPVERRGFKTKAVEPAYTKEMKTLTASDLKKRIPGEDPYHPLSVRDREAYIVGKDNRELDSRINRLEEVMCAEALLTGKVVVKGEGFDEEVDFGYKPGAHIKVLSGTSVWNNPDSDPLFEMKRFKSEINQRCGKRPTMMIVGSKVAEVLISHPKIKEMLNILNYKMGEAAPKELPEGVDFIGKFMPSGLEVYTYEEWYIGQDDIERPVIPEDVVLIGTPEAECSMHYGLIENMECLTATRRFPWSWKKDNRSHRIMQMESAPMPCIKNPNAFIVAHVLN